MSNKIKHSGVIESIGNGCVCVRIMQASACSACKVAAHCNASETKEKIVEVNTEHADGYRVGDRVVVVADAAVGFRASLYGYLLPLALMVVALVVVLKTTLSEGLAAVSALGVLIPYYIGLYLLRGKIKNRLSFAIERERE
ncbi:MAG TPA: RseC/MucC family positive regulator of sigma(E) [Prevotella sp.]|nr:SoxR reducing system RseC family protein [uncultured Prevotella sp.]HBF04625.1 RseC/MucC family positive regulator of sigma(E) [Candidatus Segatella violae]